MSSGIFDFLVFFEIIALVRFNLQQKRLKELVTIFLDNSQDLREYSKYGAIEFELSNLGQIDQKEDFLKFLLRMTMTPKLLHNALKWNSVNQATISQWRNTILRSYCLATNVCVCDTQKRHDVKLRNVQCIKIGYPNNFSHKLCRYSTHSDQRRQKVVIESTRPSIIEKIRDTGKISNEEDSRLDKEKIMSRWEVYMEKIDPYVKLARWDKPIGVYLLYWPCSWSIALASLDGGIPLMESVKMAALFGIGAGLMRGAGCTVNDMWDRRVDAQVERTKNRPLVTGAISKSQAVGFLGLQLSLALAVLLQLNCFSVVLGASSMLLVITYPLAKRVTNYPQLFLGLTFNWGALLGYSAIQGTLNPAICLPLYTGALAWTIVYDTIYAHQDKEDDARIGMKSTALTFGSNTKPALYCCLAVTSLCLAQCGMAANLHWPYYAAVTACVAHIGNQIHTLNTENPADCAEKFKSNWLVGLIILAGIIGGGYNQYLDNRLKNKDKEDLSVIKSCVFG